MKIEPVYKISYSETYKKYQDIAKVEYDVFLNRMTNNYSNFNLETALLTPKVTVGKDKWKQLAIKNGINVDTYKSRVRKGWDREVAATTPSLRTGRPKNSEGNEKREKVNYIKHMFSEHGQKYGYELLSSRMKVFYNNNKELFEDVL